MHYIKNFFLICLCITFVPLATAQDVEDIHNQGVDAFSNGNYNKAAKYLQKACDNGSAQSCGALGSMYYFGQGVKQNYVQALKLGEQSCNDGFVPACFNVAILYDEPHVGIKQNYTKSAQFFEKSCIDDFTAGCASAGVAYHKGIGVKHDYDKAAKYHRKACDDNVGVACRNLAILYQNNQINSTDNKNICYAVNFFEKACNFGDQKSCEVIRKFKEEYEEIRRMRILSTFDIECNGVIKQ